MASIMRIFLDYFLTLHSKHFASLSLSLFSLFLSLSLPLPCFVVSLPLSSSTLIFSFTKDSEKNDKFPGKMIKVLNGNPFAFVLNAAWFNQFLSALQIRATHTQAHMLSISFIVFPLRKPNQTDRDDKWDGIICDLFEAMNMKSRSLSFVVLNSVELRCGQIKWQHLKYYPNAVSTPTWKMSSVCYE